ncbi:MAG: UDP-3-O-[3-hydroxymyristoyl] N-acetylglucosamine deacetylase [Candidatus Omnitrophica bacterium]|nr:UDP-3-O-[3-hydroxymyristoyl] N-acetylglucosamine deacetylase [Candidatus Omnitrophota bacterium]
MTENQRTIKSIATIRGIGIQTGRVVNLKLEPAPPDTGIIFVRTDLHGAPQIKADPSNLKEWKPLAQRTILRSKNAEVQTAEHFLAALSGLFIDNVYAKLDNLELPGLDGSSREFVSVLREIGFTEQDAPRRFIEVEKPIICGDEKSSIQLVHDEEFKIEYFLDYDHPCLRQQWFDITLNRSDDFMDWFDREVAPSRTFCMEKEAATLLRAGLGKGADFTNTLVIGNDGPINNKFRFDNEPARHKLLDLLGDLYVFGRHIKGRLTAKKSGHKLNNIFIKRLQEELGRKLVKTA